MFRQIAVVESVNLFKDTVPVVDDRILLIQIDIRKICPCECSCLWLKLSGDDFQESSLSAAVGPFYAEAVATL